MSLVTKKRALIIAFLASFVLFNISSTLVSAHTTTTTPTYVDKKLGFSLQFPTGWVATPQSGRVNTSNTSVIFTNVNQPGTIVQIGVMQRSTAATDFAARGKPTLQIGSYPAFQTDTRAGKQVSVPCLGRIFLAHNDTVIATWCSSDAPAHAQQFDTILATYHDHTATSSYANAAIQAIPQNPVNPVLTCGQVMQNAGPGVGPFPTGDATFGAQRVNPNDAVWTNSFGEGVAVCDDYASSTGAMWEKSYLFQCVELANRFINEEWGLSEFGVDAFAYYDNYQGGVYNQGEARTLFGNQVQLTDDASQGNNSALPQPGDLLVFQDVNDGTHWTSGEISGKPGHVVVVTSVTSTQVNVVQENWYNGETWSFPVSHLSNGYHIIDNSGWLGRITRGWIHFSANNNNRPSTTGIATTYNGQQWTAKMQPDNHIEISNRQSSYYFSDTTKDTPSIAFLNGKVFVAFLGNDNANQIHLFDGAITSSTSCPASNPCHFPGYILYDSSQTTAELSSHGPALSSDATHLYLAFTGTEAGNTGHVHIEQTTDGTTSASWTNRADLAGTTNNAPSTTALNGQQWVAYKGTDGRINLATSQSNYTFTDTTSTTPAISFLKGTVFVAFLSSNNSGQIHLFDGAISSATSCPANNACHFGGYILDNSSQTTAETASGSPALASTASSLYLAFPGTETPTAHAHIEDTTGGTSSASWGDRADLGA